MKLSKHTLNMLKNFSDINMSIEIKEYYIKNENSLGAIPLTTEDNDDLTEEEILLFSKQPELPFAKLN